MCIKYVYTYTCGRMVPHPSLSIAKTGRYPDIAGSPLPRFPADPGFKVMHGLTAETTGETAMSFIFGGVDWTILESNESHILQVF